MGGRWNLLVVLAITALTSERCQAQLEYNITTTWNGDEIDHEPIQLTLSGSPDGQHLELGIEAPFFDDPAAPQGPPGLPFLGLWNYEVVEAFFLNDDNQYLEVEVGPWGQHIVLLLKGQRETIRHSLPLEVSTTVSGDTWNGTAKIPVAYLPQNVTKFNAYGIHGSGDNRTYESLYPAPKTAARPDFHALEYFGEIDLNDIFPDQGQTNAEMSELWSDSIEGIFRYRIETTWNGQPIDHPPAEITLQGLTGGVELNVTAPFFNDPAPPGGEPGKPYYGLWEFEVVEMFFLNENDEYLEVEVGPWGEHLLLMLKGARNTIKHSLSLDYFVERNEGVDGNLGTWKGSALLPPEYFPPKVNRMNAYAIHGTGETREYQALYPAPYDDPDYQSADFHRLDLFQPLDFEYLVTDNSDYSDIWEGAINSSSNVHSADSILDGGSEEVVTVLGPSEEVFMTETTTFNPEELAETTTLIPLEILRDDQAQEFETDASKRKPNPQRVELGEPREQRRENPDFRPQPAFAGHKPQTPQPVRVGNRRIPANRPNNKNTRLQSNRPFVQETRPQVANENSPQSFSPSLDDHQSSLPNLDQSTSSSQFQAQGQVFGISPLETNKQPAFPLQPHRPSTTLREESPFQSQGQPSFQGQPPFQEFENQGDPQFSFVNRPQFQDDDHLQFQFAGQPDFQDTNRPPFQTQGRPQFQTQGRPQFQTQGRPQFQTQGRPQFQTQGRPQFQTQGRPPIQTQGPPQFHHQGQRPFQNEVPLDSSSNVHLPVGDEDQPDILNPGTTSFQSQEPSRFGEERPSILTSKPSQFELPDSVADQTLSSQSQTFDVPGSQSSVARPSQDVGLQETITPDVQQAVITLAEGSPALPPPHPVCFELGLVPDANRCYVFHECVLEEGQWQMYSWRCRRGQIFDPVNVACVRGRCARNRRRRIRRPN